MIDRFDLVDGSGKNILALMQYGYFKNLVTLIPTII
jgi:hypothetical protein